MANHIRKSGINVLGDIPWGSHFCQFYQTREDLLELLIPYFKAGLESNEFCFWITADPITKEEAYQAMEQSVPNFGHYLHNQSIEVLSYTDWYIKSGTFEGNTIKDAWLGKLGEALERGFEGMRVNGNETWLRHEDCENFMQYERELNNILYNKEIIVLCTYPLTTSAAQILLDVAHAHERVISRRKGNWEILEEPEIQKIKTDLVRMNIELDARVAERTQQLNLLIQELKHEIEERKKVEEKLNESYRQIRSLSEHLQNIREDERTRIAREIHDELGQLLTVMKMDIGWLNRKINDNRNEVKKKLQDLSQLVDATVQSVRRISSELRPSLLDDLGLVAAMEWHLKECENRSGIKTFFQEPEEELELSDGIKTGLFRIFQESLTNVVRHSQAREVHVSLTKNDGMIRLSIRDNGTGFDPQKVSEKRTLGILGMKERTAVMGGEYQIQTEPGKGTTVTVLLPVPKGVNTV